MTKNKGEVTGGVDTHVDTHTAAVLDEVGRTLEHREFPATPAGYRSMLRWMRGHGVLVRVGVEGTGSYGAGLARYLHTAGVTVIEVDRPDRKARRTHGKSDPVDAEAAARAALSGRATGIPKSRDGIVEAIRVVRSARTGAVKARVATQNALISLGRTAPEPLRAQLGALKGQHLVAAAAALRPGPDPTEVLSATKIALRRLARRWQHLTAEIDEADRDLLTLTRIAASPCSRAPASDPKSLPNS